MVGRNDGSAPIQALLAQLNAPKWKFWHRGALRLEAAQNLAAMGESGVDALIESLSGPGAAYAGAALVSLGPSVVPILLKALRGPGAAYAVHAITQLGSPCLPELINELSGPGAAYAVLAIVPLGMDAIPSLADALKGPGKAYARLAIDKVIESFTPEQLITQLGKPGAAYAVISLEPKAAQYVPNLIGELSGEGAANASLLLRKGGARAVAGLTQALKHPNVTVRMWAAMNLGAMGDAAASSIPALAEASKAGTDAGGLAAKQALDALRNKPR